MLYFLCLDCYCMFLVLYVSLGQSVSPFIDNGIECAQDL